MHVIETGIKRIFYSLWQRCTRNVSESSSDVIAISTVTVDAIDFHSPAISAMATRQSSGKRYMPAFGSSRSLNRNDGRAFCFVNVPHFTRNSYFMLLIKRVRCEWTRQKNKNSSDVNNIGRVLAARRQNVVIHFT